MSCFSLWAWISYLTHFQSQGLKFPSIVLANKRSGFVCCSENSLSSTRLKCHRVQSVTPHCPCFLFRQYSYKLTTFLFVCFFVCYFSFFLSFFFSLDFFIEIGRVSCFFYLEGVGFYLSYFCFVVIVIGTFYLCLIVAPVFLYLITWSTNTVHCHKLYCTPLINSM